LREGARRLFRGAPAESRARARLRQHHVYLFRHEPPCRCEGHGRRNDGAVSEHWLDAVLCGLPTTRYGQDGGPAEDWPPERYRVNPGRGILLRVERRTFC